MIKSCKNCANEFLSGGMGPCHYCEDQISNPSNWEPRLVTFTVTEEQMAHINAAFAILQAAGLITKETK